MKGCNVSITIPDVFMINHGSIDEEHLSLAILANGLLKIAQNGPSDKFERAFEALIAEFASHFEHEEILMAEAEYDGLDWHKDHHNESLLALERLYASCRAKGIIVPEDVYVCFDHVIKDIAKVDLKFAEFLDSSGKR